MAQPLPPSLEEVQHALEDVKRIRSLLDTSRQSQVLRRIFRPVMLFGFLFGPNIALFAGLLEWVHRQPGPAVWGLGKTELMWLLGGGWLLVNGMVKMLVFRVSAQREGHSLMSFMRRVYRADYLRLLVPLGLFSALTCVTVARLGAPGMIAGLVTMTLGVLWILLPLALPIPESPLLGWFFLLGGALALFVLPAYPFLKVAVLWGLGFGAIMPLAYWAGGDAARADAARVDAGGDAGGAVGNEAGRAAPAPAPVEE